MSNSIELSVNPLSDRRVAFVGKLGGVTRKRASQLVRERGGSPVDAIEQADLIVVGADELPLGDHEELLTPEIRQLAAEGKVEIISETYFWQHQGLIDDEQEIRRLYTPGMLAKLLHVPVTTIRRWHRRGLIVPVREIHRLPYFDFQEVSTARRIAELVAAGASPKAIESKLIRLSEFVPDVERPLAQLSVIVEGKEILLRRGEGLVEPGGQMRFDFEAIAEEAAEERPNVLPIDGVNNQLQSMGTFDEMLQAATHFEDNGQLEAAIQAYRTILLAFGPNAEIHFQLAELLYRIGQTPAARERYYAAVELDEDFVEARANLGCVLAELEDFELAVLAFEGALRFHPDFPDVHFHLARTLDQIDRKEQAQEHWIRFLQLSPDSPWADEARVRLGMHVGQ